MWGSVAASALTLVTPWISRGRPLPATRLLGITALLSAVSTLSLTVALLAGDFSLEYVARTTSLATPWAYRLAAVWGAMEGSLLFYAALTTLIGWVAVRRLPEDLSATAARVVGLIVFGLLLLTAAMASPFTRLAVPAVDGEGLLAILQHPAMVYHPPILYFGLTSLVVPFAVTVAAVFAKRMDLRWIRITRRWLILSWTFLTVGMVAGANWAYVELGWGGFWAWDPVENTSLMPWLAATVFLHTSLIQERDGRLARWNVWFALSPFLLTLLGVYLTRSGVTGSIHAFAESPVIGRILIFAALIGVLCGAWVTSRVKRGGGWERVSPLARDTWLAVSGGLVAIALVFVTVGSAYPAFLQVFHGDQALVRPGFFVGALTPIAMIVSFGLAFAFGTRWVSRAIPTRRLVGFFLAAAAVSAGAAWAFGRSPVVAVVLAGFAGSAVGLVTIDLVRKRPSGRNLVGHLAHLGMALVLLGSAGSSLGEDFTGAMGAGEAIDLSRYTLELDEIRTGESDRFVYVAADMTLTRNGGDSVAISPEIRAYEEQALPVPEPALHSTPVEDVVVAISRVAGDASVVEVNVFVRPLVFWVWAGAALIAVSGLVSLSSTGAAGARRRRLAREGQPAERTTSAD